METPLFWSWPGHVPAQATRPELVSSYDLLPTLCDCRPSRHPPRISAAAATCRWRRGKPLPKKQPWRTTVFAILRNTGMARVERYKLVVRDEGKGPENCTT